MKHSLLALAGASLLSFGAEAAVVISVTEVGSDVVFSVSGTLDLTDAVFLEDRSAYTPGVIPGGANWYYAQGTSSPNRSYQLTTFAGPFGTSTAFFGALVGTSTGDTFGIWGDAGINAANPTPQLFVDPNFVSGSPISGGWFFSEQTFTSLGLTPGTYVYSVPNDTVTLNIVGMTVPEPTSIALVGLGLVGLASFRRSRAAA